MDYNTFLKNITSELNLFNFKEVSNLCQDLLKYILSTSNDLNNEISEKLMQRLRNKRQFNLMLSIGDALIQYQKSSHKISRQYAQALIEKGHYTSAILVLNNLLDDLQSYHQKDSLSTNEIWETKGLIGRTYKQLYVNSNQPKKPVNVVFLKKAIQNYNEVYKANPIQNTWHGINLVALLWRAQNDNISIEDANCSYESIAEEILGVIDEKNNDKTATAWDFATAAEACIAFENEDSLVWLSGYARHPFCDAFELGSTLRQFEEVWLLNEETELGSAILSLLKAELINREGGTIHVNDSVFNQNDNAKKYIEETYNKFEGNIKTPQKDLEKVFSEASFRTYRNYSKGLDRCRRVARIGRSSDTGHGTGFLINGKEIHTSLETEELFLLTNAHVVSNPSEINALRPSDVVIIFESLNRDIEFEGLEVFWSSPSDELDTTILRFKKEDHERLNELIDGYSPYPISEHLPYIDNYCSQKIYVIGHPYGGTMRLSLNDNKLLDHENPFIHYRTPTDEGSSGSPVFNEEWDLIGIHHAGHKNMKRLNNKEGTYEANEGIWIQSILNKLRTQLESKD